MQPFEIIVLQFVTHFFCYILLHFYVNIVYVRLV